MLQDLFYFVASRFVSKVKPMSLMQISLNKGFTYFGFTFDIIRHIKVRRFIKKGARLIIKRVIILVYGLIIVQESCNETDFYKCGDFLQPKQG